MATAQNYAVRKLHNCEGMTKWLQVRLCRQKTSGKVYAMKKLKKAEMVRRGQVRAVALNCWVA